MKPRIYSKKKLISLLKEWARNHGETPSKRQWNADASTPSDIPYRTNFGSWGKSLKVAGLKAKEAPHPGRKKGGRNKSRKRLISIHGYVHVFEPKHPCAKSNGYVLEHRLVAWNAGLLTDKNMNVHHKNGNKTDNRLENLEVISHADHVSHHWKGVKRSASGKPCAKCPTLTRSQYGLCTKHYREWWDKCHRRKISSHGSI